MKRLGTAEGLEHFHRQGLLNQAERDRLTRTAATQSAARQRPHFSISRLLAGFGPRLTGRRAGSAGVSSPPQSA